MFISYLQKDEPNSSSTVRLQSPNYNNSPGASTNYFNGTVPEIFASNQAVVNQKVEGGYQQEFYVVVANPSLNNELIYENTSPENPVKVLKTQAIEQQNGFTNGIATADYHVILITEAMVPEGDLNINVRTMSGS
jgi:hypothetical protein